ncbi:TPA: hypothetical protein ACN9GX_002910, partial [Staphylococcus aureus]
CQILFSRLKKGTNVVISTITPILKKERYFYIVSRQEETRFTRFKNHEKIHAYFLTFLLYSNCFLVGTNKALCVVELVLRWD